MREEQDAAGAAAELDPFGSLPALHRLMASQAVALLQRERSSKRIDPGNTARLAELRRLSEALAQVQATRTSPEAQAWPFFRDLAERLGPVVEQLQALASPIFEPPLVSVGEPAGSPLTVSADPSEPED